MAASLSMTFPKTTPKRKDFRKPYRDWNSKHTRNEYERSMKRRQSRDNKYNSINDEENTYKVHLHKRSVGKKIGNWINS